MVTVTCEDGRSDGYYQRDESFGRFRSCRRRNRRLPGFCRGSRRGVFHVHRADAAATMDARGLVGAALPLSALYLALGIWGFDYARRGSHLLVIALDGVGRVSGEPPRNRACWRAEGRSHLPTEEACETTSNQSLVRRRLIQLLSIARPSFVCLDLRICAGTP
jgi:hypothetical protein